MPSREKIIQFLLHPNELRAAINYKIWHDPLRRLEDDPEGSGWNRESMRNCWDFLDRCSRSFAGVIKELEGELGRVVCLFYLVLRACDTIEDDMTLELTLKEQLLNELYLKLEDPDWKFEGSGPNEADRFVLVNFPVVQSEYARLDEGYRIVISDICRMMGKGMAQYARHAATSPSHTYAVDTLASLDLYCHYVAGLVGEGLSRLFANSDKENNVLGSLPSLSNSMGLMLQKTNIMRDFREDLDEGRLFWPKEIWGKYVDQPQDLYRDFTDPKDQKEQEKKEIAALNEMCMDALHHAIDALDYLSLLKNQSVFNFCAIPQVMAMATLAECWGNRKVFRRNVKIRRGMAVQLILKATNPREAALIFHKFMLQIHAKTKPDDPTYLRVAIMLGRISQWMETRYPSFVPLRGGQPNTSDVRLKTLPESKPVERPANNLNADGRPRMTGEDMKFLSLVLFGTLLIILVLIGFVGAILWFGMIREGSPFHHWFIAMDQPTVLSSASPKVEL